MARKDVETDARLDWGIFKLCPSIAMDELSNFPPQPLLSYCRSNLPYNDGVLANMGRSTGPTVGCANGCRPETRVYHAGVVTVTSTEAMILNLLLTDSVPVFASKGDSGGLLYDCAAGVPHSQLWGRLIQCGPRYLHLDGVGS